MTRLTAVTSLVAAAALLAGCGGSGPASTPATTAATSPPTTPSTTAAASPSGPLLRYAEEGGIAGVRTTVEVAADGTAEVQVRGEERTVTLPPGELAALRSALQALPGQGRRAYGPTRGADLLVVRVEHGAATETVSGGPVPPELTTVLDLLASVRTCGRAVASC